MTTARTLRFVLVGLDAICLALVFLGIQRLWGIVAGSDILLEGGLWIPFVLMALAIYLIDGYNLRTDMMSVNYASQHIIAMLLAMSATLLVAFVIISVFYVASVQSSRSVVAISFALLTPLTLLYRRSIYQRFAVKRGERSLVFLGDRASCLAFRDEVARAATGQKVVYTVVTEGSAAPFPTEGEPLRPFAEVIEEIQRGDLNVEAIVLRESSRELQPDVIQRLVALYFNGVPTYTLELFHQVYWRKIPTYRLNQIWLFQEGFQIAREPVFERVKRATDILCATLGLLVSSPVILLAAIAIRLEDRGPVFFRQTRIGRNHVPFRIVKLRTMRVRSDAGDRYTQPGDSRITRIGALLRASRLDELPQLWNVLTGDMSVIGPRPEWDRLVCEYEEKIPCYFFRHLVKPGITGWAQVNYPYGANLEDTIRKLEYDLYYIRHFSFTLDASIVLKTIHVMLFGKGR